VPKAKDLGLWYGMRRKLIVKWATCHRRTRQRQSFRAPKLRLFVSVFVRNAKGVGLSSEPSRLVAHLAIPNTPPFIGLGLFPPGSGAEVQKSSVGPEVTPLT
jgi:hypothetical protein